MMDGNVLPPAILQRKAVVYVRQSTQSQVELNTESRRCQYDLVETARRHGFRTVDVIDDELMRWMPPPERYLVYHDGSIGTHRRAYQ